MKTNEKLEITKETKNLYFDLSSSTNFIYEKEGITIILRDANAKENISSFLSSFVGFWITFIDSVIFFTIDVEGLNLSSDLPINLKYYSTIPKEELLSTVPLKLHVLLLSDNNLVEAKSEFSLDDEISQEIRENFIRQIEDNTDSIEIFQEKVAKIHEMYTLEEIASMAKKQYIFKNNLWS
ncbi:MAG: hypothetical protein RSE60_08800 [Erysipelotrichaceae bacterium]